MLGLSENKPLQSIVQEQKQKRTVLNIKQDANNDNQKWYDKY